MKTHQGESKTNRRNNFALGGNGKKQRLRENLTSLWQKKQSLLLLQYSMFLFPTHTKQHIQPRGQGTKNCSMTTNFCIKWAEKFVIKKPKKA